LCRFCEKFCFAAYDLVLFYNKICFKIIDIYFSINGGCLFIEKEGLALGIIRWAGLKVNSCNPIKISCVSYLFDSGGMESYSLSRVGHCWIELGK
jgi:hypothetical protein